MTAKGRPGTRKKKATGKPTVEQPRIKLSKDEQHYIVNGDKYARMTHVIAVLDPEFEQLKERMADKMAEYAAYGTLVHRITELDDKNKHKAVEGMLHDHPELAIVLAAWRAWVDTAVDKFIAVEQPVWSSKYKCAGTIDRVVVLKGDHRPSILDIKTSSGMYDSAFIQMAGYKLLYNGMVSGRDKAVRTVVVWMPRPSPGDLTVKERTAKKWEEKFLSAVKQYGQMAGRQATMRGE